MKSFDTSESLFLRKVSTRTLSLSEYLGEIVKPCDRFRTPFSFRVQLELIMASLLSKWQVFTGVRIILTGACPLSWSLLLSYLWGQGLIKKPVFSNVPMLNDLPQNVSVSLHAPEFEDIPTEGAKPFSTITGFGVADTSQGAYAKAVGELLERFFLSVYHENVFIKASHDRLVRDGKKVFDIGHMNGFLSWQKKRFPRLNTNTSTVLSWLMGRNLTSGGVAFIPAQLVFWNYKFLGPVSLGGMLTQPTTNGGAGHYSLVESVSAALLESIERDSFFMFWLNSISPPLLELSDHKSESVQKLLGEIKRFHLEVFFLDTTTDIEVPSCVCVLLDKRSDEAKISVGAAAGFSVVDNLLSAAREALGLAHAFSRADTFVLPTEYEPFTSAEINRNERLRLWRGKKMLQRFQFFIDGKKMPLEESRFKKYERTFKSTAEEYGHLLDLFKKKGEGYEVYSYSIKSAVLSKLNYFVTRVSVPALFPLYLTEHLATLDSKRLREVPRALGYNKTELNPWPHPFP